MIARDKVRASLERWAVYYGVRRELALAWMESGFQVDITSQSGAWGVMQVIPDTWTFAEEVLIGTAIGRTADGNVRVGLAYLGHLLRVFGGDERLALAGYFQGPRSVQMFPPPHRDKAVRRGYARARRADVDRSRSPGPPQHSAVGRRQTAVTRLGRSSWLFKRRARVPILD